MDDIFFLVMVSTAVAFEEHIAEIIADKPATHMTFSPRSLYSDAKTGIKFNPPDEFAGKGHEHWLFGNQALHQKYATLREASSPVVV